MLERNIWHMEHVRILIWTKEINMYMSLITIFQK